MQLLNVLSPGDARTALHRLGCDPGGIAIMQDKALFKVVSLSCVRTPAALILKQDMLSLGGDAACHRDTITGNVETTEVLLFGTVHQLRQLCTKLARQSFGLADIGRELRSQLDRYYTEPASIPFPNGRILNWENPHVMGILNCTPDSFSDGGQHGTVDAAIAHALKMRDDGASVIDIGGESTRPGALPVSVSDELARVIPVIQGLHQRWGDDPDAPLLSIDTTKADVARHALTAGAQILNDISALRADPAMAAVVAESGCAVVLMHMQGTPTTMQTQPQYDDVISDLLAFFSERITMALAACIREDRILIDPGIGFGKTMEHNLVLLNRLDQFQSLGRPIVLGTSRKSFIGTALNLPVDDRMEGTAATVCIGILKNAKLFRVHDVGAMGRVLRMTATIRKERL
jgi:dihydropteroate synthase